ncbi:hypothetical protein G9A89_015215 [Geosiphon pyriformis]|nr:hypothetical protein G9A89_015215 [Geosiphon pyriformis]
MPSFFITKASSGSKPNSPIICHGIPRQSNASPFDLPNVKEHRQDRKNIGHPPEIIGQLLREWEGYEDDRKSLDNHRKVADQNRYDSPHDEQAKHNGNEAMGQEEQKKGKRMFFPDKDAAKEAEKIDHFDDYATKLKIQALIHKQNVFLSVEEIADLYFTEYNRVLEYSADERVKVKKEIESRFSVEALVRLSERMKQNLQSYMAKSSSEFNGSLYRDNYSNLCSTLEDFTKSIRDICLHAINNFHSNETFKDILTEEMAKEILNQNLNVEEFLKALRKAHFPAIENIYCKSNEDLQNEKSEILNSEPKLLTIEMRSGDQTFDGHNSESLQSSGLQFLNNQDIINSNTEVHDTEEEVSSNWKPKIIRKKQKSDILNPNITQKTIHASFEAIKDFYHKTNSKLSITSPIDHDLDDESDNREDERKDKKIVDKEIFRKYRFPAKSPTITQNSKGKLDILNPNITESIFQASFEAIEDFYRKTSSKVSITSPIGHDLDDESDNGEDRRKDKKIVDEEIFRKYRFPAKSPTTTQNSKGKFLKCNYTIGSEQNGQSNTNQNSENHSIDKNKKEIREKIYPSRKSNEGKIDKDHDSIKQYPEKDSRASFSSLPAISAIIHFVPSDTFHSANFFCHMCKIALSSRWAPLFSYDLRTAQYDFFQCEIIYTYTGNNWSDIIKDVQTPGSIETAWMSLGIADLYLYLIDYSKQITSNPFLEWLRFTLISNKGAVAVIILVSVLHFLLV